MFTVFQLRGGRYLTMEERQRLLSVVSGADHLAFRLLIQLGLRSEELFALRRNEVIGDMLRIDEAIVEGASAAVKTEASEAMLYVPPDLRMELQTWLEHLNSGPMDWLFPSPKGAPLGSAELPESGSETRCNSGAGRRLKRKTSKGEEVESTDVNFQVLRRTCATLFGAKAKDPRDTQAQLRHADPSVTLRHYQKSIPASVRAAAVALESE